MDEMGAKVLEVLNRFIGLVGEGKPHDKMNPLVTGEGNKENLYPQKVIRFGQHNGKILEDGSSWKMREKGGAR